MIHRCLNCNKHIKDKRSIERGYGPECWQYISHNINQYQNSLPLFSIVTQVPENTIIIKRDRSGLVITNILHTKTKFNKYFDYGSTTAGSKELAYNLMLHFGVGLRPARHYYHDFMLNFITPLKKHHHTILESDVINWLNKKVIRYDYIIR